jgi:hypothetical protein
MTNQHRVNRHNGRRPDYLCALCRSDQQVQSVPSGQTIIGAQMAHQATHSLVLRQAVDDLVNGLAGDPLWGRK